MVLKRAFDHWIKLAGAGRCTAASGSGSCECRRMRLMMLPQKWCMVDKACCSAADMLSIECSTGVEANHGGAAGAVVLVQTILDHVGFAGLDVDARRAVTPRAPCQVWRREDVAVAASRVHTGARGSRVVAGDVKHVLLRLRLWPGRVGRG